MSLVNYATREITCKIVYCGPGRSGKTTNLQYIHSRVPWDRKGEMVSLATEADRTLFFDFLPLELGKISGFTTRFQLYTVPGQEYYNATRKLVLQGADGIIFVADSQRSQLEADIASYRNLHENLVGHGVDIRELPVVIQYNKRDLPNVFSVEMLEEELNFRNVPSHPASALLGEGVFNTLRSVSEGVLRKLANKLEIPAQFKSSGGKRW
jgi:signal recognition particle receptor subunit beta